MEKNYYVLESKYSTQHFYYAGILKRIATRKYLDGCKFFSDLSLIIQQIVNWLWCAYCIRTFN